MHCLLIRALNSQERRGDPAAKQLDRQSTTEEMEGDSDSALLLLRRRLRLQLLGGAPPATAAAAEVALRQLLRQPRT